MKRGIIHRRTASENRSKKFLGSQREPLASLLDAGAPNGSRERRIGAKRRPTGVVSLAGERQTSKREPGASVLRKIVSRETRGPRL